jgi:hypothetical protein
MIEDNQRLSSFEALLHQLNETGQQALKNSAKDS